MSLATQLGVAVYSNTEKIFSPRVRDSLLAVVATFNKSHSSNKLNIHAYITRVTGYLIMYQSISSILQGYVRAEY